MGKSTKWQYWRTIRDGRQCAECVERHGEIYSREEEVPNPPELHDNCRCAILILKTIQAGRATTKGTDGADFWLVYVGQLPPYYLSKDDAKALGWKPKLGNLHRVCPGQMIFGGVFLNDKGKLPDAPGRVWYEADINYVSWYRNTERILFSNDGLIFVTYDHYKTFYEIV